ncbi:MAG: c(7)-type cytochrome triheme domain-containing protein [Betaproteobacteria bacterium]
MGESSYWGAISAKWKRIAALVTLVVAVVVVALSAGTNEARAEYGDVVMNNYSDSAGMRPVVFPHWFHRVRFRCKVCHSDLGFKFRAGGNDINMLKIIDGQFCGACHNGSVAWSTETCDLCHSAKPGTPTQVHESTVNLLGGATGETATSVSNPAAIKPKPGRK